MCHLRADQLLVLRLTALLLANFESSEKLESSLAYGWLDVSATSVTDHGLLRGTSRFQLVGLIGLGNLVLALLLLLAHVPDAVKANLGISGVYGSEKLRITLKLCY
jgi:hypothetical protein